MVTADPRGDALIYEPDEPMWLNPLVQTPPSVSTAKEGLPKLHGNRDESQTGSETKLKRLFCTYDSWTPT